MDDKDKIIERQRKRIQELEALNAKLGEVVDILDDRTGVLKAKLAELGVDVEKLLAGE
jgi:predicted nuclease with TOPRIM domain